MSHRRDAHAPDGDALSATLRAWTSKNRSAATRSTASCCSSAATRRRRRCVMGAASCDVPAIVVSGGPCSTASSAARTSARAPTSGSFSEDVQGRRDRRRPSSATAESRHVALGRPLHDHGHRLDDGLHGRGAGHSLPHNAAIPAVDARRYVLAHMSGTPHRRDGARRTSSLSKILTRKAFENAIRVNGAIGGSTNAVIHLLAIAGRIGVRSNWTTGTARPRGCRRLVDLMPSGRFLMEEFYYAGGLPAVLRALGENGLLPQPDAITVNGQTIWENIADAPSYNDEVIRPTRQPVRRRRRHLQSCAATSRRAAPCSSPRPPHRELLRHRGRAVVFENHRALQGAHRRSGPRGRRQLACWC